MEAERHTMDAVEVIEILGRLEPGNFWLKISVVEQELKLDRNTLGSFVESIKNGKYGSTRRQTELSPEQAQLEKAGIFFRPGHVAVCIPKDTMPKWDGPKYADIRDPKRSGATDKTTLARSPPSPSSSESSSGARTTSPSPTCERRSPLIATREDERSRDSEDSDGVVDQVQYDIPAADLCSDDESMTDLREVGRPESPASPTPGDSLPTGQALHCTDATTAWSEDLAINVVFQVLIRTNTWNCFLEAGCLAKLIDEDELEVRRILKNRKGERRYPASTIFLRSFGIIERPYKQKTRWCLLGLGALDLTLQDCHHREYVMSAEPGHYGHMSEKERRTTDISLAGIPGPWEPARTDEGYTSACDGPARLVQTAGIQEAKEAYIAKSEAVQKAEQHFRDETGRTLTVSVAGSSQRETFTVRHIAWSESREWTFFSHCCNGLGGHIRSSQPCAACDCNTTFVTTCIRANAFMSPLGTNFLESMNATIAAKATKRSDFNRTHWARAQIAIMNRTHEDGSLAVANLIRSRMGLPALANRAASGLEAHDRRGKSVVVGQMHETAEQKSKKTNDRYRKKDRVTAQTAANKALHDKKVKENKMLPFGHGTHGVAELRKKVAAEGKGAEGTGDESDSTSGKSKKKRKRKDAGGTVLPEYSAGGSNTDNNDKLAADARMGGTKTGGACSSCLQAGVGRHFLVEKRHARKGARICDRVRKEWKDRPNSI